MAEELQEEGNLLAVEPQEGVNLLVAVLQEEVSLLAVVLPLNQTVSAAVDFHPDTEVLLKSAGED
jgi:hypothetical protein